MSWVSCISLVTPVGYSAASSIAAMRGKIAAFNELSYHDAEGEPIIGATVDALPLKLRGRERISALVKLAFEQLDADTVTGLPWGQMPLLLCTRENEMPGGRLKGILAGITLPDGRGLTGPKLLHIAGGPVAVFTALSHAETLLKSEGYPACIIVAVDSLVDARTLSWLDLHQRLKTSAVTDGLVPGEAAGILVVTRDAASLTAISILGIGFGVEGSTLFNETPFRADGLSAALKAALADAGVPMHKVSFRLSDVAGESYAFEELVLAQMRNMREVRPCQDVWHAADCIGDSGAAAGIIQFAWAEQAYARNYAPGKLAALHASSCFGPKAAAIVAPRRPS
ncbi:hypothetical protein NKH85_09885 [Mesorhizobium sp. M0924]|uniref:hypothetical protein n=1 Tax=unclassified Mesorhizobium TaxID=325217 RepID=UPI0004CDF19F